jgi:hypothetical protein
MPIEKRIWRNEQFLRLALLQELADVQADGHSVKGLEPKRLRDILQVDHFSDLVASLCLLNEQGYVDAAENLFVITELGLKYLEDLDKGVPGDWPPHSRVPRRPSPESGSGELAVPETSLDEKDEFAVTHDGENLQVKAFRDPKISQAVKNSLAKFNGKYSAVFRKLAQ